MIYGYARVSTIKQGIKGNSLEEQEATLKNNGAEVIFQDMYTGTTTDRPKLNQLIQRLQPNDTLIVTKLDRLTRTASEGIELIQRLVNNGVKVHILNMGYADNSAMGKLMITILAGFAEFERDQIIERTQTGRTIARQRSDYVEGRPKLYGHAQIEHALSLLDGHTYKEVEQLTGISKSTLIRAKRNTHK